MADSITPGKIKQSNKNLIYKYIYEHDKVSQMDICVNLKLSRPTVMTNLNEMEADGLIGKTGQLNSGSVGRKASAYSIVPFYKAAIGVEIVKNEVKMMALNLRGERMGRQTLDIEFENSDQYYRSVSARILDFINELRLSEEQILGISFAIQGLVSPNGQRVIYGKILDCTGLTADVFQKYLPYDCRFIHDADSAAFAELWSDPGLQDAFFISISRHTGGALIHDRQIVSGKHGHSATFEHIPIRPAGSLEAKRCYCGKTGCVDTLCSLDALLQEGESADAFFESLGRGKQGETASGENGAEREPAASLQKASSPENEKRWQEFLKNMGEVLNMLHLVYDTDLVIGGYLAPYLTQKDLDRLYDVIASLTPFEEPGDYLHISKMPRHSITIGGALQYIREYLDRWWLG